MKNKLEKYVQRVSDTQLCLLASGFYKHWELAYKGKNGTLGKWGYWFLKNCFIIKILNTSKSHWKSAIVKILSYFFCLCFPLTEVLSSKSQTSCYFTHMCYVSLKSRLSSYPAMLPLSHLIKLVTILWNLLIPNPYSHFPDYLKNTFLQLVYLNQYLKFICKYGFYVSSIFNVIFNGKNEVMKKDVGWYPRVVLLGS